MFVIYDKEKQKIPIKVWLESKQELEESCLKQAMNLANLPFAYSHIALMPDTHLGYGMPIGGILATKGIILPHAVGSDVGCGMSFAETNKRADELGHDKKIKIVQEIMNRIPTGQTRHTDKKDCRAINMVKSNPRFTEHPVLGEELDSTYFQLGTLGSNNHFIELQKADDGKLCIMLHSGSRNFGFKVARHFNNLAKDMNAKWHSSIPPEAQLAFLPTDSDEGKEYIEWMNLALDFAKENRDEMMKHVMAVLERNIKGIGFDGLLNVHHNYAAIENHFGKNVWVHRKGAIKVRKDELGIIPGAMGGHSYIVRGLGNADSFFSCSHGAGRKMSRKEAKARFKKRDVLANLEDAKVVLGKNNKQDIGEEAKGSYKNIEKVIKDERDLVEPVMKLKTVCVIKG